MEEYSFMVPERKWNVDPVYEGTTEAHNILRSTLEKLYADEYFQGHSDVGVRNLIYMLAISIRPRHVLEVGGHLGAAALVIGSALKMNNFGHHYVLEPNEIYNKKINGYVEMADLKDYVTPIKGFSTDENIIEQIKSFSPFQIIFIDAQHTYDAALHDLQISMDLLEENGIIVLHDTSELAESYDSTGKGGVRQALLELCRLREDAKPIFFEWPLWVNQTGTAMLVKQNLKKKISESV